MKKDFLFSEELRERMKKFGKMDVSDAIKNPNFYEALLEHCGLDNTQKNEFWEKVGRTDLKKDNY